ncbi:MAG: DUF6458 family protein [Motilibacteraceae bacterium]|jgi:hypothetical protein
MGIGVSVFLIAVGAILSFAVQDAISGVNLVVVGYILMAAGVLGIIIALVMNNQRTHTSHTTVEDRHVHNDY